MKCVYCLCIVNLLLLTSDSDAGLVKPIISSIHDTAHKIRDDIHQALYFKEDPKKNTDVVTVADHKTNDDRKFVASSTAAYNNKEVNKEATGFVMPKDDDDTKLIFQSNPTTKATVNPTTKATVNPTTEATVNFTSTTVKNGRENFAGGCSTGYERTVDGRCRPTF